jgi:hypothetical protein
MLNQIVMIGKLVYIYDDIFVLDVDDKHFPVKYGYDKMRELIEKKSKAGDLIAIKGHLIEGVKIVADRVSFLEYD